MDDKKFTVDDAADLFGEDEIEEVELDPEEVVEEISKPKTVFKIGLVLDSKVEEYSESDDIIMDIKDKALDIVEKSKSIYKLTLQGRLEIEFPLADKRTIRKAVNSLKDHPGIKWPHGMLLEKV